MTLRQKNLLTLLAIVGIFVGFIVAGRLVNVAELPKVNQGTLIVPHVPIKRLQLKTADGQPVGNSTIGHWSLLYIAAKGCERACKNALFYQMKRTRRSLGADGEALRLLVVETHDNPTLRAFVKQKLPNATLLHGKDFLIQAALGDAIGGVEASTKVYLLSPDGMLFMWYPSHADKQGTIEESAHIHADLKRTLKGALKR